MDGIDKIVRGGSGNRRRNVTPIAVLTDRGRKKLESPGVPEYEWRILNHLSPNEFGPSSVKEIASEQGIPEYKVKSICKALESEGFIKRAGSEG